MTNQPGRWNRPETECIRMRMVFEWTVIRQFGLGAGRGLVSKTDREGASPSGPAKIFGNVV